MYVDSGSGSLLVSAISSMPFAAGLLAIATVVRAARRAYPDRDRTSGDPADPFAPPPAT